MAEPYDAIIIGAGIIGACTAFELAKRGWRTINLDRLPAAGYGSTGASCAIIRVHYSTLDGTAFAYEGYFYWDRWADYLGVLDERGLARFHKTGCLVMKTATNGRLANVLEHIEALGIPWEDWDAERIRARLPIYDLRQFGPPKRHTDPDFGATSGATLEGGVYFPTAGYISDPQLATHNVQVAAEAAGGRFAFNKEVAEILLSGARVAGVRCADGARFEAPVVVNVAGPHSDKINRMAGVTGDMTIGTKALRQEVAHVPSPAGFDFFGRGLVVSDSDIGVYSRPEVGNHILFGSEDPECDPREFVDPDDYTRDFTEQWSAQVYRAGQRIPDLAVSGPMKGVVDLYDVSDDWIPIYDRSSLPGFYMAVGTSGNQFKNAPVAGVLMAELIGACEAGRDHDTDPVRFHMTHSGRTLDVGFFSRRRPINPESSFSVLG